jgi:DNA-directed RNA polymerase specialized sigma24 family protein
VVNKSGSFFTVQTTDGEIKEQGEPNFMKAIKKLSREARNDLYDRLVKASMEKREALATDEPDVLEIEAAEEAEEEGLDEVAEALTEDKEE